MEAIRSQNSDAAIELLIPDLDARPDLLDVVIASKPDIIGHNIETVERLTPVVRSRAKYRTSLETLRHMSRQGVATKSGLMVGLGESDDEVLQTLHDLREAGVGIVTLGQYLRPTLEHYPVAAYITPEKFEWYRLKALEMGFAYCASAPLVRSSYLAEEALQSVKKFAAMKSTAGTSDRWTTRSAGICSSPCSTRWWPGKVRVRALLRASETTRTMRARFC